MPSTRKDAADLYEEAATAFDAALERLARAYEADPDRRRDLLQEIHIALWRSFANFDGRCSLRTWIYRVAHNTAISQVMRRRVRTATLVDLDQIASMPGDGNGEMDADRRRAMERILTLIRTLAPLDRQVILLYLEGEDAATIGDVTGLSASNVATKVHRIKRILSQRFHEEGRHGQ
jgi:RNA polymerase sigma-70 factor (ECF subfamily)